MARYKNYSYEQQLMVAVSLEKQILPGTFEYTLNTLIDEKLDLTLFHERYNNDETGAPAYDPAVLLKIILFAYSRGINTSRKIAKFCEENIVCMALAADTQPHFTTIAHFISSMDRECVDLFTKILAVCYTENLIGKNMFAIDGCKISSNCSKEWSGTKEELLSKVEKIRKSIKYLVDKHQAEDRRPEKEKERKKEEESIKKLKAKADKINEWLEDNEDRVGTQGKPVKSNITDNESAKMATSHGVVQGYNGIAAVDDKHQTIVFAEVYGDINESGHLPEVMEGVKKNCREAGIGQEIYSTVKITADSGFHNERNMELIHNKGIEAIIADNQFRKRDVRFNEAGKYKKKIAEWQPEKGKKYYRPEDFFYDEYMGKLICPEGHEMWLKCRNFQSNGGKNRGITYMGHIRNCMNCKQRSKCIRKETTKARQVLISDKDEKASQVNHTAWMRRRFDTPEGRSLYSKRMGTVEPVFGHIAGVKRLNRFTLRSKKKVNNQWLLYCMVHNIGKIQVFGGME